VTNQNNQNIAVAFESKSGDALAVYENNASTNLTELQYRTFTAGAWSAGTNFYGPFVNPTTTRPRARSRSIPTRIPTRSC
jgi:hypothetical protein